jgi:hypothetical protein
MNRRSVLGIIAILIAVGVPLVGGFSFSARSGSAGTHVSAQLSPVAIGAWPIALLVVLTSWRERSTASSSAAPAWYRVLLALYVDFSLYLVIAFVPLCLLAVWLESVATGSLVWEFSRDFGRSTDGLTMAASLPLFALCWASLGIPMWASRQSPGGILAGISLHLQDSVPFWRCAVFGVFKYFALAAPAFGAFFDNAGGFQARASASATQRFPNKPLQRTWQRCADIGRGRLAKSQASSAAVQSRATPLNADPLGGESDDSGRWQHW